MKNEDHNIHLIFKICSDNVRQSIYYANSFTGSSTRKNKNAIKNVRLNGKNEIVYSLQTVTANFETNLLQIPNGYLCTIEYCRSTEQFYLA